MKIFDRWAVRRDARRANMPPGPRTLPNARGVRAQGGGQYNPAPYGGVGSLLIQSFNGNDFPGNSPLGIPNVDSSGVLDNTGMRQPLPMMLADQLLQSPRTRYQPFTGHSFVHAQLPDPGAPAWTFDALGLVEFSPIGTGIPNQEELRPLEGAPYFSVLGVPTQGLGGIVQGGVVSQALAIDPITADDIQIG